MNLDDPEERDLTAAEYVTGSLVGPDRDAFERVLATDAALQASVYAWQDRLLDLARRTRPEVPSPGLWARIEQRIAPRLAAANDTLWNQVRTWRWTTGLAAAAAVVLAVLLALRGTGLPDERYVAVLQSPDGQHVTGWLVEVNAGQQVRLVPAGDGARVAPPPGRALQFWTKPKDAKGPTSLGLVKAGTTTEVPVARLPALGSEQLFEVTLEPENGSPIGRPTGPVLYVGSTVRL